MARFEILLFDKELPKVIKLIENSSIRFIEQLGDADGIYVPRSAVFESPIGIQQLIWLLVQQL